MSRRGAGRGGEGRGGGEGWDVVERDGVGRGHVQLIVSISPHETLQCLGHKKSM